MYKYSIKLGNGRAISGATCNNGLYEAPGDLGADFFEGGLREVKIERNGTPESVTDEEGHVIEFWEEDRSGTYYGLRLGYLAGRGGKTEFVLVEPDARERELESLRGDVAYLSMMSGVSLDG